MSEQQPTAAAAVTPRHALLLLPVLLLLPAALSGGLDPVRLGFLLFVILTGAASLWLPRRARPAKRERRRGPPGERPSRDAVLDDLKKAAAASPHGAKIRIPDASDLKAQGGTRQRVRSKRDHADERRIEEVPAPSPSPTAPGERWSLAREH
eukprot:4742201-Prymnesium_polylepis.1